MILTVVRPRSSSRPEDELEVFCRRLSIISSRDMDGTVTVVFRSMLQEGRARPVGSSELAGLTRLNRVTIIHHLQRLEQMGLVEHTERKYRLRVHDLGEAVEQMREQMMRSFEEAESIAERLDKEMDIHAPLLRAEPVRVPGAHVSHPHLSKPRADDMQNRTHAAHPKRRLKRAQS